MIFIFHTLKWLEDFSEKSKPTKTPSLPDNFTFAYELFVSLYSIDMKYSVKSLPIIFNQDL